MGTLWLLLLCVLWQFAKAIDLIQPIPEIHIPTIPSVGQINGGHVPKKKGKFNSGNSRIEIGNENFVNIPNFDAVFGSGAAKIPSKPKPIRPRPPIKVSSIYGPSTENIIRPVPPVPSSEEYPSPRPPIEIPSGIDHISSENPHPSTSPIPPFPITPRPVTTRRPSPLFPVLPTFPTPPQINIAELIPPISFPKIDMIPPIDIPELHIDFGRNFHSDPVLPAIFDDEENDDVDISVSTGR